MNKRFATWALTLAAILTCVLALPAQADWFSQGTGEWNDTNMWRAGRSSGAFGTPALGDACFVQPGHDVTVKSADGAANCGSLTIEDDNSDGGQLLMDEGAVLTLSTSNGIVIESALASDGRFRIVAISTQVQLIAHNNDASDVVVTLNGYFEIEGAAGLKLDDGGDIGDAFQLPNGSTFDVQGLLDIDCVFDLDGTLDAHQSNTTYRVAFHAAPASSSAGLMKVSGNANARIIMDVNANVTVSSDLDLEVSAGQFQGDQDYTFTSAGGVKLTGGSVLAPAPASPPGTACVITFTGAF